MNPNDYEAWDFRSSVRVIRITRRRRLRRWWYRITGQEWKCAASDASGGRFSTLVVDKRLLDRFTLQDREDNP